MSLGSAAKGVAEFFNLSSVSKAWSNLGGKATDDLAMNINRISKSKNFVTKVADELDDSLKKDWSDILSGMKSKNASETAEAMDAFLTRPEVSNILNTQDETFKKAVSKYLAKDKKNAVKYFGREEKGTVSVGRKMLGLVADPQYGGTRIATTAAAYGGTALAVRTLSGGNLTTNARGERDIAGIPIF